MGVYNSIDSYHPPGRTVGSRHLAVSTGLRSRVADDNRVAGVPGWPLDFGRLRVWHLLIVDLPASRIRMTTTMTSLMFMISRVSRLTEPTVICFLSGADFVLEGIALVILAGRQRVTRCFKKLMTIRTK